MVTTNSHHTFFSQHLGLAMVLTSCNYHQQLPTHPAQLPTMYLSTTENTFLRFYLQRELLS
jgi:hypothetical protein